MLNEAPTVRGCGPVQAYPQGEHTGPAINVSGYSLALFSYVANNDLGGTTQVHIEHSANGTTGWGDVPGAESPLLSASENGLAGLIVVRDLVRWWPFLRVVITVNNFDAFGVSTTCQLHGDRYSTHHAAKGTTDIDAVLV